MEDKRIVLELENAILEEPAPSAFFEGLRRMDRLAFWFPETESLIGLPQNAKYHPEGDVWVHTMQVLDEAALLREAAAEPLGFMLSALCHDFGKTVTTNVSDGGYHAYGHEKAGLPLVRRFLRRVTKDDKLTAYVLNMTALHMEPNQKACSGSHIKSYMKMFDKSVCPEDLLLLAKADHLGRIGKETDRAALAEDYADIEGTLREMLAIYRERMSRPYVGERELIEAGAEPGPVISEALSYVHKLRLAGIPKEEQLKQALGFIRGKKGGPGLIKNSFSAS